MPIPTIVASSTPQASGDSLKQAFLKINSGFEAANALVPALSIKANLSGASGATSDVSISDLSASIGLGIIRAQIASYRIPIETFRTIDGAPWVRGNSTSPMAIADASGQWWGIDVTGGRVEPGWFRLTADGSDWGPAWNRAISSLNGTNGGEILVRAGTYTFASKVVFPKNGKPITVRGTGACSVLVNANGNNDFIFEIGDTQTAAGGSNITVECVKFAGTDRANSKAVRLLNANGTTFRSVSWSYMGVAVSASDSYAVAFTGQCTFDNIENYCWYSNTPCHNLIWDSVRAYTCGVSGDTSRTITGQVLRIDGPSFNIVLDKCDVEMFSSLIQANNGLYAPRVTGCYLEYAKSSIFVGGTGLPIQNMEVSGNLFYGNGNQVWRNLSGGAVRNNVFSTDAGIGSLVIDPSSVNVSIQDNAWLGGHIATQSPWQVPVLTNSWNQQVNYTPLGYRLGADGMVSLRGCAVNYTSVPLGAGTTENSIFTLPVGYRPATIMPFATANTSSAAMIFVYPDGTIRLVGAGGAGTSGNPYQAGLNGISFQPNN